ncbi:MAG: TonB-dependent receptor [Gelidibacter sp.]
MKLKLTWLMTLFMAFMIQISFAQEKSVSGTITAATDGLPLPGVNVIVKGTTRGVQTDFDGNYTIKVSANETLLFSFVGMKTVEKVVGTNSTINVQMQEDAESLAEIVVVGFSTKSRDELTSAVSNVTSEDLEKIAPSVSIDNMLQGVASGVQVTAQNGKPGQTAFIRVRGIGSINAGNQPLYIVDGARVNEDDVNGINPSDVESVSVLKDAASTSIYGAQGGNGVVIITTKRGKKGQEAVFKFSSRIGRSKKTEDNFKMMNAAQKLQYERELGVGPGASLSSNEAYQDLVALDHDWKDDLLQDGLQKSINFSASGGEERMNYFFSLGYDEDTGIIQDVDAYNRVSGRLNVDYQAKDWAKLGTSLSFSSIETTDPRDRNNAQNPFRAIYDYNPYETKYVLDDNGNPVLDDNGNPVLNATHAGYPVTAELTQNVTSRYYNRVIGNLYLDLNLAKNLKFLTQGSGTYEQYRRENFLQPGSVLDLIVNSQVPTGSKTDNGSFDFTYTWLNKATYSNTFGEVHNLELTALTEYTRNNFRTYTATGTGFVIGGPSVLDVAATPLTVGGGRSEYTIFSIAGNVDYNYDDRYILNATVRRDGSSRFGKDSKYGNFYSGSLAWNISNEAFMEGSKFSTLKLRASAGTSGNDQIGRYTSITTYGFGAYNNGSTTIVPANFGDPTLSWEQNFNYGLGLEFGLWNNRLRGLVDYYNRTTSDLLLAEQLPLTTGGANVTGNLGEMVNKGFEFELAGDVIRNEKLKWTVSANLNLYDNEVTKLVNKDDPETLDVNESDLFTASNFFSILRVGEEVNTFYLTRYAGVNPANGEALYYDVDGNITNNASGNEVALSGKSPFAELDGSISTSFQYEGFDLSANFYYKVGNYIYNTVESNLLNDGSSALDNQRLDAFNYWRNPGDVNVLPSPLGQNEFDPAQTSDRFLQKGDYIRLRSLQLGYTLPSRFTETMALKGARIYVSGTNLWTYAPYFKGDPEVGIGSGETQGTSVVPGEFNLYSYPTTSTISVGVDIQF